MFFTFCQRQFDSHRSLCRHIRNSHTVVEHYMCYAKFCRQSFKKLFNYERHLQRFHYNEETLNISQNQIFTNSSVINLDNPCMSSIRSSLPKFQDTEMNARIQIQTDILQYCSEVCSKSSVPFNNIISTMNSTSNYLMSGTINYLKTETIKVLQNLGEKNEEQTKSLIEKFEFCSNSMQNFNSKYKILKSFKANHRYIAPVEVFLGSRYEQKLSKDGIPQQIPRKDTCQYISIAETMRHIISFDGLINLFQAYKLDKSTRDFALCCIQDGFYYYSNPTFTAIDTITIELYIDDVELVNPLGSHTGIHKLGFVYIYFTIKDLPVSLQSSLGSIFLTNVHYSLDVEKYGYKAIFEPLIQDLKQLLDHGIEFRGNTYKIALWQILGDNLGLNKLFGFVECFSANFCCRFCLVHKNEMQKMFKEDNSLLCHKVGHDAHVRDVINENITTAMCGVKSDCPFNELGYWHVTNNLVVDVMHDLLEGWSATETYLILHQYIFKDKFLTLSVLNDRISNFNYGKCNSRCKPVPIKREKLSNLDGSNGQSASQMWVLMRIFPLLIGDKVPYNNDFWNLYLLMLTIIDTLMAPVISLPETYALAENIADHHKLFLIFFPNRHLTPKMHFALHYPRIIRQLWPPVRYWSMRYESKHYPSKTCTSSSGNFLNVAKTVAVRHQLKMAHIFNKKNFKMPCITNILGSKYVQVCNSKQKELLCTIDGLTDQMEVITCNSLCYNGTVYSKNMAVLIGCVDDLPLFGKIKELFLHDNMMHI
ncbi:uncharacterized protein LOC106175700 [Trichonephila clavipes]|nr:uncharacterized protein LOC106175700 [Trichonephila clavipes]